MKNKHSNGVNHPARVVRTGRSDVDTSATAAASGNIVQYVDATKLRRNSNDAVHATVSHRPIPEFETPPHVKAE